MNILKILLCISGLPAFLCSDSHPMNNTTSKEYIGIIFHGLSDKAFEDTRYSRKRDFYRTELDANYTGMYPLFPLVNLYKIIADSLNATLIPVDYWKLSEYDFPIIHPFVTSYGGSAFEMLDVWESYRNSSSELGIVQDGNLDYNFVYCDVPKLKKIKPWHVHNLSSAFTPVFWLLISIAAVLISIVLHCRGSPSENSGYLSDLFLVYAALYPVDPHLPYKWSHSKLLVLWMFFCLVMSNLYAGIITSDMIAPQEDDPFTFITQLAANNFTVTFSEDYMYDTINATVRQYNLLKSENEKLADRNGEDDDMYAAEILLDRIDHQYIKYNSSEMYFGKIYAGKRIALLDHWPVALSWLDEFKRLLKNPDKKIVNGKCTSELRWYIGKRLLSAGNTYQMFIPPDGQRIRKRSLALSESGIYYWWGWESVEIIKSKRVQDRNRHVSPTIVKTDRNGDAGDQPLKMEGKVNVVFFVMGVGLLIGVLSFFVEVLYNFIVDD